LAVLNVSALAGDSLGAEYITSVRLGLGVATSMAIQGETALLGCSTGSIFSAALLNAPGNLPDRQAERVELREGLPIGVDGEEEDSEGDCD
jgi:hypothetical protein